MQLIEMFRRTLAALEPPGPFALAVSGGPDSTALMYLAAAWRPAVFTVDHGLRPESAAEAAGVAAAAARLGLKHETLVWEGPKPAAGLQAAAREARYRLLAEACRRAGAAGLMTGHTLDDQIETIAMRRERGSGPLGLAGMAMQTHLKGSGARLVRPLLWTRKAALLAFLDAIGAAYVTDPSNADPRFDRGRIRLDGAPETPAEEIAAAMRARVQAEIRALAFLDSENVTVRTHLPLVAIGRAGFRAAPAEIRDLILAAVLRRVGGEAYPGTRAERARLAAAIAAAGPFAARTLAGCLSRAPLRRDGDVMDDAVVVTPETAGGALAAEDWWLPFGRFRQIGPAGDPFR